MELVISGLTETPKTIELNGAALSLGRSADNDLAYPEDPWLSRLHLRFEKNGSVWFIKDCGSRNGTVLNGVSVTEAKKVTPGDRIVAGHLNIEVRDPAAEMSRDIVSFVPQRYDPNVREKTIYTTLEKVLRQEVGAGHSLTDPSLTSARAVQALIRAGQELASHRPLEEVFVVILDLALAAVGASRGVILTLENGELILRASKGEGFTISTSMRDRVLREKKSLSVSDAMVEAAFRDQKSVVAQQVRSVLAVPLQTGDRVIGLIYVDRGTAMRPFSAEDLDLLTVMANVAAIRIEHARLALVEQSEKLMESEYAQASEIQRSLLPTEIPSCPGYELAGFNLPCYTVGGDYYDFLPYADGRLTMVVGDVSGKGLPAALMMSSLQARVHMLVESSPSPDAAVTLLNRNLAARCPLGKFITFFYALLDPATGTLRYTNAGHNYPLLIRADKKVLELRGNGIVLGIMPNAKYEVIEEQLGPGDTLVLFSDGVTEARSPDGLTEFGEDRLASYLARQLHRPLDEVIPDLVAHVRGWSGQQAFADDFTLVLVRRQ